MAKRVLVVDDSPDARAAVMEALSPVGYKLTEAVDGADGMAKLKSLEAVSAVVIDINMPVMDGLQMLKAVRAEDRYAELPILMLTTEADPKKVAEARAVGAQAWLQKPCAPNMLRMAMKALVG